MIRRVALTSLAIIALAFGSAACSSDDDAGGTEAHGDTTSSGGHAHGDSGHAGMQGGPCAGDEAATTAGTVLEGADGALKLRIVEATPSPFVIGDNQLLVEVLDASDAVQAQPTFAKIEPTTTQHGGHGTPQVPEAMAHDDAGQIMITKLNFLLSGPWQVRLEFSAGDKSDTVDATFCIHEGDDAAGGHGGHGAGDAHGGHAEGDAHGGHTSDAGASHAGDGHGGGGHEADGGGAHGDDAGHGEGGHGEDAGHGEGGHGDDAGHGEGHGRPDAG